MDEKTRKLLNDIRMFMDDVLDRFERKLIYYLPPDMKGAFRKYKGQIEQLLSDSSKNPINLESDEMRAILVNILLAWSNGEITHLPEDLKNRIHKATSLPQPPQDT